jgi:D-alanine-D-alanine ligase
MVVPAAPVAIVLVMAPLRVGVIFGGRSGEHEVSLASAASVIAALERRGHTVVPIGIARDGRWVVGGDPLRALASQARVAMPSDDATRDVKKALTARAESIDAALASTALARTEPAGGMPVELRAGLDVAVIMLHGPYGEDGTIQGLLELADVPYVGAGVLASAVGMDKATMKAVFSAHGLPVVEYTVVLRREWRERPEAVARRVAEVTGFPCFVKPCNLGSSVGITRVMEPGALAAALDEAARHDRKIVVERGVRRPREVEVSVLGNDAPEASLPGEITYDAEWYDYATKYAEGQARVTVPAPIGPALTGRVREVALAAFRAIDAAGMARVDFFIEGERVILNEINTIPGFTATSAYARLWEASGLAYGDLVERLIGLALERFRDTRGS